MAEKYAVADCLFSSMMDATSEYQQVLIENYKVARDALTMCAPEEFDALYEQYAKEFADAGFAEIAEERKEAFENGNTTRLPAIQVKDAE